MFQVHPERGLNDSLQLPECRRDSRAQRLALQCCSRGGSLRLEDRLQQNGEAKAGLGELGARLRLGPVLT
jgi:hypothetical protein